MSVGFNSDVDLVQEDDEAARALACQLRLKHRRQALRLISAHDSARGIVGRAEYDGAYVAPRAAVRLESSREDMRRRASSLRAHLYRAEGRTKVGRFELIQRVRGDCGDEDV